MVSNKISITGLTVDTEWNQNIFTGFDDLLENYFVILSKKYIN